MFRNNKFHIQLSRGNPKGNEETGGSDFRFVRIVNDFNTKT